jgi:hypothetical protein
MWGETKPMPETRRPSATIDWLIAASMPPGWIVVTDDRGEEFVGIDAKVSSRVLLEALETS